MKCTSRKTFAQKQAKTFAVCPRTVVSGRAVMPLAAKVLKKVMVNTGGTKGRSPQNVKTAAPETQKMMGLKTSTEGDTSWQFVALTRSSRRASGKRSGSPLHPQRGRMANLQVATSESWRDKQTGEMGSRQNGIAWCCSASSRKWQVISAQGRAGLHRRSASHP